MSQTITGVIVHKRLFLTNGLINIEINSSKFRGAKFPFYLIFRLFGMTSDRDIVETIVYDLDHHDMIRTNLELQNKRSLCTFCPGY